MCYETAQLAYRIYREAKRLGASPEEVEALRLKWEKLKEKHPEYYHVKGFDHPDLAVLKDNSSKIEIGLYSWGLIPEWVKDNEQAKEIVNRTLLAKGETMFDKPAFRDAVQQNRVIVPVDGYFEHHHKNKVTFPYFVHRKDKEKLLIGGISTEWRNRLTGDLKKTFALVTTAGNQLMADIHNNPKIEGPRMPLLLEDNEAQQWLYGNENEIKSLIRPNTSIELVAHTVQKLSGQFYKGNSPSVQEEKYYPELIDPPTLFD